MEWVMETEDGRNGERDEGGKGEVGQPCRAVPGRAVPCRTVPFRAVPCRAVP